MTAVENANAGEQYEQYTPSFAEYWDDLVGWDDRLERDGPFYGRLLNAHGAKDVADVACGTGVNAVALALGGFNVTATDGSENMLEKARENAKARGATFNKSCVADWLTLDDTLGKE